MRAKIIAALRGARAARSTSDAEIERYVDGLPFAVAGTFGGHTSCVEIETGASEYVLCDLGSGLRPFGQAAIARHGPAHPQTYHIFVSHVHWDHIMGLPFFSPAYIPGNRLRIYGGHRELEAALRRQMDPPSFPVDFSVFNADIEFVHLEPGQPHDIAGMRSRRSGSAMPATRTAIASSATAGPSSTRPTPSTRSTTRTRAPRFVEFFRDADLVIFDAMYSLADAISVKADWGHSSNIVGVELCQLAGRRHLCLFHHEPAHDDAAIARVLEETRRSRRSRAPASRCAFPPPTTDWN